MDIQLHTATAHRARSHHGCVKEPTQPAPLGVVRPTAIPLHTAQTRPRPTRHITATQPKQNNRRWRHILVESPTRFVVRWSKRDHHRTRLWRSAPAQTCLPVPRVREPQSEGRLCRLLGLPARGGGILGPDDARARRSRDHQGAKSKQRNTAPTGERNMKKREGRWRRRKQLAWSMHTHARACSLRNLHVSCPSFLLFACRPLHLSLCQR